jgi:hypothetical protein
LRRVEATDLIDKQQRAALLLSAGLVLERFPPILRVREKGQRPPKH